MSKPKFLACDQCKTIVQVFCEADGAHYSCCGQQMKELTPNTSEGATEKHLPVVEKNGNRVCVKVGSVFHPMTEEHSIGWVYLETEKGGQRVCLKAGEEPQAEFVVAEGDRPVAAYAWCNLHGFWKAEIH